MINIQQNNIIKIFSVVAVMFMPPTLVASIYGMNFEYMPELSFTFGYPYALALIVLVAVLPYVYFRRRGWFGPGDASGAFQSSISRLFCAAKQSPTPSIAMPTVAAPDCRAHLRLRRTTAKQFCRAQTPR